MKEYQRSREKEEAGENIAEGTNYFLDDSLVVQNKDFSPEEQEEKENITLDIWKQRFLTAQSLNEMLSLFRSPVALENFQEVNKFLGEQVTLHFEKFAHLPLHEEKYFPQTRQLGSNEFFVWMIESNWVRNFVWNKADELSDIEKESVRDLIVLLISRLKDILQKHRQEEREVGSSFEEMEAHEEILAGQREFDEGDNDVEIVQLLSSYGKLGFAEVVPYVLDFLKSFPSSTYTKVIAEVISNNDPHEGANQILQLLKQKDTSPQLRAVLERIMYHIECGRIPVQKGQLEYLFKKYNLRGELKDNVASALRITPDGKLGLLDADNSLIGYIEFGNFENEEEKEAVIMEIANEHLWTGNGDETQSDAERKEFFKNYVEVFVEGKIMEHVGIQFNNVPIRAQFWFYKFILNPENKEKIKTLSQLAGSHMEAVMKTFIGLEFDVDFIDKLIVFLESKPKEQTELILEQFQSLFLAAENAEETWQQYLVESTERPDQKELFTLTGEILKRGITRLEKEMSGEGSGEIKEEMAIFAAMVKTFCRGNEVNFEMFRDVDIQKVRGGSLIESEEEKIIELVLSTRKSRPEVLASVRAELGAGLQNQNNTIYILTQGQENVACMRFEKKNDGCTYASNLSVHEETQHSGIGRIFSRDVFAREASEATLLAEAFVDLPALQMYIEENAFVATGLDLDYKKTGRAYFRIERSDAQNKNFTLKKEFLLNLKNEAVLLEDAHECLDEKAFVVKIDSSQTIISFAEEAFSKGYRIVRYFTDEKDGGRYYGFEQAGREAAALETQEQHDMLNAA